MIRLDIKCHVEGINLEDGGLSSEGGGRRVRGSGKDRENVGTGTLNFISQWRKLRPERGRASCSAAMAAVAGYRRPSGVRPGACTLPQFGSLEAKREGSAGPRALRAPGKNPSLTGPASSSQPHHPPVCPSTRGRLLRSARPPLCVRLLRTRVTTWRAWLGNPGSPRGHRTLGHSPPLLAAPLLPSSFANYSF